MSRSKVIQSAFGAAFMAAACLSSPAYALEDGQCGPRAEIIQALHDEGQVEVISGRRTAIGGPKNIFTTNASLNLGYNFEASVIEGVNQICVGAKYTDIRLNGDAQLVRPNWSRFGADTPNDKYIAQMEGRFNDKVLMGATTLVRVNGQEVRGPFMMVLRGDAPQDMGGGTLGSAVATSSRGGINTLLTMANINTNENFDALAKTHVRTASADASHTFRPR